MNLFAPFIWIIKKMTRIRIILISWDTHQGATRSPANFGCALVAWPPTHLPLVSDRLISFRLEIIRIKLHLYYETSSNSIRRDNRVPGCLIKMDKFTEASGWVVGGGGRKGVDVQEKGQTAQNDLWWRSPWREVNSGIVCQTCYY